MKLAILSFVIILFYSCTPKDQNKVQSENYFNLKSYFENEAVRLNKLHLKVSKTVLINGVTEHKIVEINDYKKELTSFIDSDINKASWRGAFSINRKENKTIYTSANEKIPIKRVEIQYLGNKIKSIQIEIATTNILYHSTDKLTYYPDSLYEIKKSQKIRLLKEKIYKITGRF